VTAVILLTDFAQNFWFTTIFVIVMKIVDIRIPAIHITLLASVINLSQFFHKFYIFSLVDNFGIFVPQGVIGGISIAACLYLKERFLALDDVSVKEWQVSKGIITG
jgi:Na+-translocating ferredoxin:NAD+ oxidoreductase RnfE subunit